MKKPPVKTTTIIGGKYRGKKLQLPSVDTTRSSKNRLKESFFNTLQFDIIDCAFVEMFAGSGGVGLEALSRGAEPIYFLEQNPQALQTLEQNINSMQPHKCRVYRGDSFQNIYKVIGELAQKGQKAYFYIDPPFHIRQGMEDIYRQVVAVIKNITKDVAVMVIIEHSSAVCFDDTIGAWQHKKSKKFGKTTLCYYA
ncbi:MAG: 16S rRNA (guanine(966)-N(2))-methyltransferase RsmD [Campylobacterota bacterium]